jgi:hypothetical protein
LRHSAFILGTFFELIRNNDLFPDLKSDEKEREKSPEDQDESQNSPNSPENQEESQNSPENQEKSQVCDYIF